MVRGGLNGFDDVVVAGTPAEVSLETTSDLAFGWVGVSGEQANGRHDHSRGAVAALQAMLIPEGLLHRMEPAILGECFNGGYFMSIRLDGEEGARLHCLTIQQNRAGTTVRGVAPNV